MMPEPSARPSGWYRTCAETVAWGRVAGTVERWWDQASQTWTHHVRLPAPSVPPLTEAIKLPKTSLLTLTP
jgi:hypothetical protein